MMLSVAGLRPGQLVFSNHGRDCGKYYLIYELTADRYLQLVDGNKHTQVNPKKKNIKHVKVFMLVSTEIEEAVATGKLVGDNQIVAAIRNLKNELEEGDRFHG